MGLSLFNRQQDTIMSPGCRCFWQRAHTGCLNAVCYKTYAPWVYIVNVRRKRRRYREQRQLGEQLKFPPPKPWRSAKTPRGAGGAADVQSWLFGTNKQKHPPATPRLEQVCFQSGKVLVNSGAAASAQQPGETLLELEMKKKKTKQKNNSSLTVTRSRLPSTSTVG